MEFIEVVFTTKYGNFIMRFYKKGMFSDLSVGDVMNIVIKTYNDEKDYIYISPVNGNSMFIKKKFIVGFYAHEDYT
jgi:hypothetical protein